MRVKVLIQGLNLRWLVSAADTIADHDPILQRALALTASLNRKYCKDVRIREVPL